MIGVFISILCVLLIVYLWRKRHSALRNIPQPWSWPILHHAPYFIRCKDHIAMIEQWSNQFKDEGLFKIDMLIRTGPWIVLLKPEYVKTVLSRPDVFQRSRILERFYPFIGKGLLSSTGEPHRVQKKLLSKAFSGVQMKHYMPVFCKHADMLVKLWKSKVDDNPSGKCIEVKTYFKNLTFDVIAEAAFGYHFDTQNVAPDKYVSAFRAMVEGVGISLRSKILLSVFPILNSIPFGPGYTFRKLKKEGMKILDEIISSGNEKMERMKVSDEQRDMLTIMMKAKDEESNTGFSIQLLKDNVFTFFFAGHETTATALPAVLYYLAMYPEGQEKARNEVMEFLSGKEVITLDDLNLIPYTNAFIKETNRVHSPVPHYPRINQSEFTLGEYTFPKGTFFVLPLCHLNKDPYEFVDCTDFKPERYLEGWKNGTYFTFGYGPYSCIGKNFAILEMNVVIAKLLQNFRFKVDPGDDELHRNLAGKASPYTVIRVLPLKTS